jgi:uncharacterized membrane protein YfcA
MPLWAQLGTHAIFLAFVAVAVYAQALTGFALALILLGLVGATNLIALPHAVNASTIIGFCTAWLFLWRRRSLHVERVLIPTLIASAAGVAAGAFLAGWLAGTAYQVLRLLLGVSIVACALSLWRAAQPLKSMSSARVYAFTGAIAGLLGGMFSAGGPPLVYLTYRQPRPPGWAREQLMMFFCFSTTLRLLIVVPSGQFSLFDLQLAAEALPVVFLMTWLAVTHPLPLSPKLFRGLICVLLIATGLSMGIGAVVAMG